MYLALIIFGLLTNTLLAVLVGFLGARRRIGFGWTFLISLLATPLIGLIVALLSERLPGEEKKWGCVGALLTLIIIFGVLIGGVVIIALVFG
ncbi:MAG: hypothetical protein K5636_00725 [Bacteroidales bacterium]|nr:hypothetical protein [Bacteroidales bacterium]